jgi:hypothetical protein
MTLPEQVRTNDQIAQAYLSSFDIDIKNGDALVASPFPELGKTAHLNRGCIKECHEIIDNVHRASFTQSPLHNSSNFEAIVQVNQKKLNVQTVV